MRKLKRYVENRTLFFGDNLEVLREKFPDECIDLIYLDPPFNSQKDYNILFREGLVNNHAQVRAFEDSWHWTEEAERTFEELVTGKSKTKISAEISDLIQGFEKIIGKNDVMAYLVMMTIRLIELHRVLKPTGSLYLHCDQTSSHYLKIILDVIFDKKNFQDNIIWEYGVGGVSKQTWARKHDDILFYTKSNKWTFNVDSVREPYREKCKVKYKIIGDKKYLRKHPLGRVPHDVWDIPSITNTAKERLGYPTQKPELLLERIINASSNKGDLVPILIGK